jgi:Arf-GAP/SH3 domain/ANK repeat/PH domain-containing protein
MSFAFCYRDEKKAFIRCKYEKRRYAIVTCANLEDRRQDLKQAILSRDIYALLQVYAEGIDFMDPLPDMVIQQSLNSS